MSVQFTCLMMVMLYVCAHIQVLDVGDGCQSSQSEDAAATLPVEAHIHQSCDMPLMPVRAGRHWDATMSTTVNTTTTTCDSVQATGQATSDKQLVLPAATVTTTSSLSGVDPRWQGSDDATPLAVVDRAAVVAVLQAASSVVEAHPARSNDYWGRGLQVC